MKYKYNTRHKKNSLLLSSKSGKKHKCKKLLNSKKLITGLITVVGSMMLSAQSDAATYAAGSATVASDNDAAVVLEDGAAITLDAPGVVSVLGFVGGPTLELQGDSSLTLLDADETISALNSTPGGVQDAELILNANTLNIVLSAASTYEGDITASLGGRLLVTSAGGAQTINFSGNQDSLVLNGAAIDGATGAPTFLIGANVTANVAADAISSGAGVQVDGGGTLNLAGVETLTDLNILGGGVVTTGGNLNVNDCLNVDGTLNMGGALGVVGLKGGGVINMNNFDFCIAPAAPTVLGLTFTGSGDFLKFGDAPLTLTANQTYTGTTWVGNGDLTLDGTSASDTIFVTNDRTGPAMLDVTAAGGTTPAGVLAKPGTALPTLFANAALAAGNITIGSAANGEGARVITGAAGSILAANADVTVFAGNGVFAGLQTNGNETFRSLHFDSTGIGVPGSGLLHMGGDVTLDSVTGTGVIGLSGTPGFVGFPALPAGSHTLTLGNNNAGFTYNGGITGDGAVVKIGTGTAVFNDTSFFLNTYTGQTTVAGGVLSVQTNTALGAGGTVADRTNVNGGAQLLIDGTGGAVTNAEVIYANGTGPSGTGAIRSIGGNNTLNGNISIDGTTRIVNGTDGTTFTLNGTIEEDSAIPGSGIEGLEFQTNGVNSIIDVNGQIAPVGGDGIENIRKLGAGIVDLRGSDHDHINADNFIDEGVVRIDNQDQLGIDTPSGYDVFFRDSSNLSSELQVAGGPANYTDTRFRYTSSGVVGTINTVGGTVVNTDFNDYFSSSDTAVLRKTGTGDLNILVDATDLTPVPAPGPLSVCATALFVPNTSDFAPGSGLIVDPDGGTVFFDNSANALTGITLNGLGRRDADVAIFGPSTGTLSLDNVSLIINQTVPTTFDGNIISNAPIGIDGTNLTLNGPQPGITGQVVVINGGTLTIGDYGSLGSNGNYSTNGTYVCGDGTLALNSLTGTAPLNEGITLFNNANLVNNEGANTIASEIRLRYDPLDNPGAAPGSSHTARIGALDGSLTLNGGVNAFGTPDGTMNLGLNTDAADAGTVNVVGEIEATVVDVTIGNAANPAALVSFGTDNSYTGVTDINGGTVDVGSNNEAFSTGLVTIVGSATVGGSGAVLPNDIQINADQVLTTTDTLGSTGVISGDGALTVGGAAILTLQGDNTYTGTTTVDAAGTLNIVGTLASQTINVAVNGELNTQGTERLENASTVDLDGTWNLGGNETIGVLNGATTGVVDMGTHALTLGGSVGNGNFLGNVTNSHGQFHKVGGNTQVIGGNLTAAGGIHVVNGVLDLGSNAGANTVDTSFIDVDAAGSVVLNDADQVVDTADLNIAGGLAIGGDDTVASLTLSGALTATNAGTLTSAGGYDLNNGASTAVGANLGNGEVRANGNVNLAGNTGTGPLQVQSGTTTASGNIGGPANVLAGATLTASGSIGGNVDVADTATFNHNGADILDAASLTNAGTVSITGPDTVASYTSNGGLLNGAGTLTATTITLNNNSVVNANLSGTATANGDVFLNGALSGDLTVASGGTTSQVGVVTGSVIVQSGAVLDSDGNITDSLVNAGNADIAGTVDTVQNSGTLNHNGNIVDVLTNSGTVNLAVDDTITGAYTSNGGTLNGGGMTLTAASYDLNDGSVINANLGAGAVTADGAVAINGDAAGTVAVNSGTTTQGAASTIGGDVTVAASATFNQNGTVDANLTNSGLINLDGTLTGNLVNNAGGTVHVTGTVQGTTDNAGTLSNTGMTLIGDVNNSGTLTNATNGIADTANVTNSGTFTQIGSDTVASFTQTGGTFNGGTITAAANTLSGGIVNGNLAGAAVTVDGAVTLNGELTSGSLMLDIAVGGDLTTGSAERIVDSAVVDVEGNLTLGGHETFKTITGNGTVDNGGFNLTLSDGAFNGIISGAGDLNKESNGLLTLNGANTFTGDTNVNDGTLTLGGALASTQVNVAQGAILNLDGAHLAADSVLTADGRVNVLSTSNVWDILGSSSGQIDIAAGAVLNLHGIDFDGRITGAGGIDLQSGNINLDGNSTFTGNTIISGGTAFLNGSLDSSIVNVVAGGKLVLGNNHGDHLDDASTLSVGGTVDVSSTERVDTLTVTGGTVDGGGTINATTYNLNGATVHADLGMGTLNQTSGTSTLNGNSAASPVNVNAGTLNLNGELTSGILNLTIANGATLATGGAERINDNAMVTVHGNLNLGGNETFSVLDGNATGAVNKGTRSLTVSSGNYSGDITGTGALNKEGAGELALNNAVTHAGDTNVNAGTLTVAGINNSLEVNVANGATLATTGAEQLANGGTLNANGTVNLGGNETINILNGGVTGLVNNGGNDLTLNSGSFGGSIAGTGDLNKESNGTLALTGDNTMTGQLDINGGTVELSGTIASGSVDVATNAVLNLNGDERLANNANVNVNGDLNLGGTENVATLAASGDIGGTGTLDANTYQLNGATTGANAHLGDGALTTTGTTTLNGNSAADTVLVDSGTLDLNGQLTNGSVVFTVDAGSTLNTGADERINDGGTLNANGTVNLGGDETITTLNGSGTVDLNTHSLTVSDGLFTGTMTNDHGDLNVTAGAPGGMVFDGATGTFTGATHVLGGGILTLQNGTNFASTEYEIDGFGTMNITDSQIGAVGQTVNINVNLDGVLNLDNATIAGSIANPSNLNIDGTLNVNGDSSVWDVTGGNTGVINLNNASVLSLNGIDFDGMINGDGSITATSGTVDLGGNSNFTGDLTVNDGATVELEGTVTGANAVTVNAGGTLVLMSAERINDDATLNVNGLLTLNGEETIAQFNAMGTVGGNGKIELADVNAGTFELGDGADIETDVVLGDGTLNTNGTVNLFGNKTGGDDAMADTTNVQSGTLNLHGTITDPEGLDVNVAAGATLQLHQDERIGNNAVLTSNGRVNLHGTETVTTFNLNGPGSVLGLTGGAPDPSLLIAETYNLGNGATTETGANMGEGVLNIVDLVPGADAPVTLNGSSDAATVNINPTTTLNLGAPERLSDMATVNNNGTLNIFGTETISIYNSTGTLGLAPGAPDPSCLIADVYNLNGGTIINAGVKLGSGVVNIGCDIPGVITINGNVAGEDVTVCENSTLNLNGMLTNIGTVDPDPDNFDGQINGDNLTIENNAILNLGSDERINDDAVVVNAGTVNLNGVETIGTFVSSGTLGGAGTLIGTGNTIHLINGHTSLNGTTIQDFSGTSAANPSVTSNGTVNINGTAGSQLAANNARINTDFLVIQSGTMNLDGLLIGNSDVTINNGATLQSGSADRVSNTAVVTIDNGGVWNLGGDDTIGTLFAGGQLNAQPHTLTAFSYNLTGGADINANLGTGVLNSNNSVLNLANRLDGNAAASDVNVTSGVFNVRGLLTGATTVDISAGATMNLELANRINDAAVVTNFGELDLNGNETVTTYNSNGGFLDNSGTLTAATYNLSNGASTDFGANLGTGTLNVVNVSPPVGNDPAVVLNGNTNADFINIANGTTLSTNGAVQNAAGVITVDAGGTWDVNNGTYDYARLQGNGTVNSYSLAGDDFVNNDTVAPGQVNGQVGTLRIAGDYVERGTLEIEFQPGASDFSNHDRLTVDRFVSLQAGSTLDLESINGFNANNIQCGERFNVIGIGGGITISGGWSSIAGSTVLANQTWGNQVLFDRGTGDVVGTGLAAGQTIADIPNIDANQLAIFDAITTQAIDTVGNYNSDDLGAGTVLNNILIAADPGNGGSTATKLAAINTLMPESYAGAADYALHATRSYTETATRVTPFGGSAPVVSHDEKGNVVESSGGGEHNYQVFGGYHSMELESDSSDNGHDYDMDSNGGFAGIRAKAGDKFTYGAFLGIDSGSVISSGLDLDADGTVLGAFAHYQANEKTTVWANISYGSFEFDGNRTALGGTLNVDNFDSDAFQIGAGVDYQVYSNNGFSITPGVGLRYIDASTDSITESGGPAALVIDGIDAQSLLLDLTVKFAYNPEGKRYGLNGHIGYVHDFEDGERDVDAMLASGSPYFRVMAPGLGDSAFTYGIGGHYDITDDLRVDLNFRGESRSDAEESHALDLRFTYGF